MTDKMREAFNQACKEYGPTISFSDFEMGWDACMAWQAAQSVPKDKPTECANGCPEKQVCDYCQSMDAALRLIAVNREVVELQERIRKLEAQRVPDGWKSWRDVAVHGYPKAAQEVLFVRDGKTVHGAFIGGIFWHSNERCAAALWMPLPTPLTPDAHRAMLAAAPAKEGE